MSHILLVPKCSIISSLRAIYRLFSAPSPLLLANVWWGNSNNSAIRFAHVYFPWSPEENSKPPCALTCGSFRHALQVHALHLTCTHVCLLAQLFYALSLLFWKQAVHPPQKGVGHALCSHVALARLIGLYVEMSAVLSWFLIFFFICRRWPTL